MDEYLTSYKSNKPPIHQIGGLLLSHKFRHNKDNDVSRSILQIRSSINGSYLACLTSINDGIAKDLARFTSFRIASAVARCHSAIPSFDRASQLWRSCDSAHRALQRSQERMTKRYTHSLGDRRALIHSVCIRSI